MTKQEIIEIYGQSVYEIWLQVALTSYAQSGNALESFGAADYFVRELLEREPRENGI